MVKLSRFAHTYPLNDAVAIFHSLRLKPVFISDGKYQSLIAWLDNSDCCALERVPEEIKLEVTELLKRKVLTQNDNEDEHVLRFIRSKMPVPAISVCYFILSEQCNMACKYCFLGNNSTSIRENFSRENMSIATADKAIRFFVEQLKRSSYSQVRKPAVIFYGGEPLLNYDVLAHIATKLNKLRETEPLLKNLDLSLITNGLLLTDERLMELKRLGVMTSISIDGFTAEANDMRVDISGEPVFSRILNILDSCNRLGVDFSLSVTLSEETIKDTEHIFSLINKYKVRGLGFNILMSDENFVIPQNYSEDAAKFIINAFTKFRSIGVYEDRMMRKLDAFSKAQVYFSDCAATTGGQIVIAPDGKVGVCHGCIAGKKYFVTNVCDTDFDAQTNDIFIEWSKLSPVNNENCLDCETLGICGGGCPVNAMHSKIGNTLHSIDERFCAHSKSALEFLVKDLYRTIIGEEKSHE